jgi:hypothetical protein
MDKTFKAKDRYGVEMEFELVEPSVAVEREGEMQYRIAFSQALQHKILPREKMREVMRTNGVWNEDDDVEMRQALTELATSQAALEIAERNSDDDACLEAAKELTQKRNRMWELFMVQQSSFMNSAEGFAETIKGESIMAATTVVKSTGERYWKSYREYVEERDSDGKSTVVAEVLAKHNELITEARDNILDDFPERRWLKDAKDRILESAATEVAENELAKKVATAKEIPKPKAKKRTGRKRKTTKTSQ